MKKITLISVFALLCVICAPTNTSGQFIGFGVKAGIVGENQNLKTSYSQLKESIKDRHIGYTVGAVLRIDPPLIPLFLQPEFTFTHTKAEVAAYGTYDSSTYKINTFSVPVMVGFKVGVGSIVAIRANAGPVFNLNTNVNANNDHLSIWEAFEKRSVSWAIGAGVDLLGIMVDLRYTSSFGKNKIWLPTGEEIRTSPGNWSLTFGFMF